MEGSRWHFFLNRDFDRALERFEDAVETDPEHGEAYNGRGWTWLHFDSLEAARSDLELALIKGIENPADAYAGQGG